MIRVRVAVAQSEIRAGFDARLLREVAAALGDDACASYAHRATVSAVLPGRNEGNPVDTGSNGVAGEFAPLRRRTLPLVSPTGFPRFQNRTLFQYNEMIWRLRVVGRQGVSRWLRLGGAAV